MNRRIIWLAKLDGDKARLIEFDWVDGAENLINELINICDYDQFSTRESAIQFLKREVKKRNTQLIGQFTWLENLSDEIVK